MTIPTRDTRYSAGVSADLASPGEIGGTTPAAITGTTITATEQFRSVDGSAAAPAYSFSSETNTGFRRMGVAWIGVSLSGLMRFAFRTGIRNEFQVSPESAIGWGPAIGSSNDLLLWRDASNILAQRNGATAQESRLYGTYTDASNYERLTTRTAAGDYLIAPEAAGTGTLRGLQVGKSGGKLGFYETTAVVQASAISAPTSPGATYSQAEAQSMETAVNAIRTALANIGITA
mgnify:CR=1 FL=1